MSDRHQYAVGWICAIPVELVAAKLFLDERHGKVEDQPLEDNNIYTLGKIGDHNVVVASLPDGDFPNIKVGLLVGIGGGVPSAKHDIRLGDVVVSATRNGEPGVFQYDFGKTIQDGAFQHTRFLDQTPRLLRSAVAEVRSEYDIAGHQFQSAIDAILEKNRKVRKTHQRPPANTDRLYVSKFVHPIDDAECETSCGDDASVFKSRPPRDEDEDDPAIHYGLIASGNSLMKDATTRDHLAAAKDVLCFEMEAAGLRNHFPCLVIRGICDYADSHKKKVWQGYAAMTAAAYAKDVLNCIPARQVQLETPIAHALDALANDVNELLDETHERDRVNILDWITVKDYGPEHSDRLEQRETGTGQWFLSSKTFKRWLEGKGRTLFCPGIPGAGKTVLASIVIDHIGSNLRDNPDASLAYIYFDHKQKDQHNIKSLIASLLKQLAASHSILPEVVRKMYDVHRDKRTRPPLDEFTHCLRTMVDTSSNVFIVLDALDECTSGLDECESRSLHKFLDVIFQLQVTRNVNLLATSRFIPHISKRFEAALTQEIRASSEDIASYVYTELKQMGGKIEGDEELQASIERTILEAVDGMFLMARLYMHSLRACMMTKRKVKEALERFARQEFASDTNRTHRAYDEAVLRIDSQNKEYKMTAQHALLWITYADRPLTVDELIHALAVERGTSSFDEDNMARIEDVVSVCAGLVAIDDTSGVIRLVHYTAYEYFQDTRQHWFPETKSKIASLCITYLSYEVFASDVLQSEDTGDLELSADVADRPNSPDFTDSENIYRIRKRIQSHGFYSYAATCWGHHARRAGASAVDTSMLKYLENSRQVKASWNTMLHETVWYRILHGGRSRAVAGVHLASYFGIEEAVRQLLKRGSRINQDDGAAWTPLCYAAHRGHESVVRLLLECDDHTSCSEESISNALDLCLEQGHEEVALRLLESIEGISSDEARQRSIYHAAANGLDAVLVRLLNFGGDLNSLRMNEPHALHGAATHGQSTTVKWLLDRGAQIDASHPWLGTVLNQAASNGQTEIAELLLDHGAGLEVVDHDGQTPLISAVRAGYIETVQTLIQRGANFDAEISSETATSSFEELMDWQLRSIGTPLLQAALAGREDIVQLLLECGANVHHTVSPTNVTCLLLDSGADIDATDHAGNTILHVAAAGRRAENVHLLIDRGANIQVTNNDGDSPLHHSAKAGHVAAIRLLIKSGANIEVANCEGSTPLHIAARQRQLAAVQLLLLRGANLNAVDRRYGTPLCYACYRSKLTLVQILIERGADVNAADDWGSTPMLCAVSGLSQKTCPLLYTDRRTPGYRPRWRIEVIKLLVDFGADVRTRNVLGNTALHIASAASYIKAVRALIRLGADINARNNRGETALYVAGLRVPETPSRLPDLFVYNKYWGSSRSFPRSRSSHSSSVCSNQSGNTGDIEETLSSRMEEDGGSEVDDESCSQTSKRARTDSSLSCDRHASLSNSGASFSDTDASFSYGRREATYEWVQAVPSYPPGDRRATMFEYLLLEGASTEVVDNNGLTLLWHLAAMGNAEFVQLLLHYGANTAATDSHGRTALHVAACQGYLTIIELLLTHKVEVDAADKEGRTPLWVAAWSGETEVVQLLLDHGANSEVVDTHGLTPLQVAVTRGHDGLDWILSWTGPNNADCAGLQKFFSEVDDTSASLLPNVEQYTIV